MINPFISIYFRPFRRAIIGLCAIGQNEVKIKLYSFEVYASLYLSQGINPSKGVHDMITLDKNGSGYFHGFNVQAATHHKHNNLVRLVYMEGMHKGKALFQPAESVNAK